MSEIAIVGMRMLAIAFCLVNLAITLAQTHDSGNGSAVANDSGKLFTFTLRSFTNNDARWVTKVEMKQHNISLSKPIEAIEFSVQHNNTGCCSTLPRRMLARVAAAPKEGPEEVGDKDFIMHLHPRVSWLAATMLCSHMGLHMAVPSKKSMAWLDKNHAFLGAGVTDLFIGISNIAQDDYFETVHGQNVTLNGVPMKDDYIRCGMLRVVPKPYTVSFGNCIYGRPFMCESGKPKKAPIDIAEWYRHN